MDWHLQGPPGLFNRAIMMSGVMNLCGISTVKEYNAFYHKLLDYFKISHKDSPAQRVEALRNIPQNDLIQGHQLWDILVPHAQICRDGEKGYQIHSYFDNLTRKFPTSCKVMIGDVQSISFLCVLYRFLSVLLGEGILYDFRGRFEMNGQQLIDDLNSFLGPTKAGPIISAYDIKPSLSRRDGRSLIELMVTHALFSLPNYVLAKANSDVYYYHFDEPSTFHEGIVDGKPGPNSWNGFAHHALDDKYVFNTLRHLQTPSQKNVSDCMAKAWIDFANHKEPFPAFKYSSERNMAKLKTFGPNGTCSVSNLVEDESRRQYEKMEQILRQGAAQDFASWAEERAQNRSDCIRDPWGKAF